MDVGGKLMEATMVDLKAALLIEIPGLMTQCFEELKILGISLPAVVMIGLCLSFFAITTAEEVIQKAIFAVIFAMILGNYYVSAVDYSFQISESKIKDKNQDNYLLTGLVNVFQEFDRNSEGSVEEDDGLVKTFKKNIINNFVNKPVIIMCHFIALIAILGIKVGYTICYYLTVYLAWIPLSLCVLPRMNMMLSMMFTTCLNTLITPYIVACFANLTDSIITNAVADGSLIGDSIEGTVLLILFSWGLFLVPVIVFCLLNGSGMGVASSAVAGAGLMGLKSIGGQVAGLASFGGFGKIGTLGSMLSKSMPSGSGQNEGVKNSMNSGGMASWGMPSKSRLDQIIDQPSQSKNSTGRGPSYSSTGANGAGNNTMFSESTNGSSSGKNDGYVGDGGGGLATPPPPSQSPGSRVYKNENLKNLGEARISAKSYSPPPKYYSQGAREYEEKYFNNKPSNTDSGNQSTIGPVNKVSHNNQSNKGFENQIPKNVDPVTGEIYEDDNMSSWESINKDGSLKFNNRE